MQKENLQKLAKLAVRIGVNIQKDQNLVVNSPIECSAFARALAEEAYKAGARDVSINYSDEKFSKIRYTHADLDVFKEVPDWFVAKQLSLIHILGPPPARNPLFGGSPLPAPRQSR